MYTRIKELRARCGLTQAELAERVGVRRETVVFLERGKYNPSLRLAYQISVILKSPIDEIFFFDDEFPQKDVNP
ncbi:helix-turn-helix transcriptional regulator [Methanospirillum stamsii]|uniref:Transcriptional regulator n=1 Tax=Methanospirillum stamsii TaxID=1277351 RepID=A0A2V2N698_9EURY|nr:helix-turn-helix transcriptional regulator [Methanospirillum stamsii]PWR75602.1 transcriptional regulator [Methanospirillum stamsii]